VGRIIPDALGLEEDPPIMNAPEAVRLSATGCTDWNGEEWRPTVVELEQSRCNNHASMHSDCLSARHPPRRDFDKHATL